MPTTLIPFVNNSQIFCVVAKIRLLAPSWEALEYLYGLLTSFWSTAIQPPIKEEQALH